MSLLARWRDADWKETNEGLVLAGPSAPLTPLLFEFGIHAVCGARVIDPAPVLERLMQGATFRQLRTFGVRVTTLLPFEEPR